MIKILKLTTGVEVVGHVEYVDPMQIVLRNPLQINYKYYIGALPSVSFARYIMFAENDTVSFDKIHVVNEVTARESFSNFYLSAVKEYITDVQQSIDDELNSAEYKPKTTTEQDLHLRMLEAMSVDGVTSN